MSKLAGSVTLLATLMIAWAADSTRSFPPPDQLPSQAALPDPLVMFDGSKVTKPEDWFRQRVPELKALFQYYMYGDIPPAMPVRARELYRQPQALEGRATLREIALEMGDRDVQVTVHVLLTIPNQRNGKVPVFLGMNFGGNHTLVEDRNIRIPTVWMYPNRPGVVNNRATEAGRGRDENVWNLDLAVSRGYAVATFYNGEIQPDHPEATEGLLGHLFRSQQRRPSDTATIAAWAWGIHRVVDYLVTVPELDARRIAVVGHSRLGKTALLAAAFDERIALVIPHQAGCGGTAPSRGKIGESVQAINDRFPHWFNGNFKQFNRTVDKLPFDQHCLIALCAPRPVLLTNAVEDTWANPAGQFDMLVAADSVYRFLGVEGLAVQKMPPPGKLVDSRLGYFIRQGKHAMTREDWEIFLAFADKHLK